MICSILQLDPQTWRKASPRSREARLRLAINSTKRWCGDDTPPQDKSRTPEQSICVLHTRVPYQMLPGLHDDRI